MIIAALFKITMATLGLTMIMFLMFGKILWEIREEVRQLRRELNSDGSQPDEE